jgi:RNA polymerase sigma-70 factor (ECF subfamily)
MAAGPRYDVRRPDESAWVRRAQGGDRDAFAALVDLYWERVRRWLYGLTRHAAVAEDLTQDAFVKAWTSLPELADVASFRAWLFRIARNCLLDSRRGPRAAPTPPLSEAIMTSREPEPSAVVLEREAEQAFRDACDRLPPSFREAYLLWTQEELSYAEIAQAVGATEVTARWRVCKARQLLLKELEPFLDAPP